MGKISFRYILSTTIILHNHVLVAERKKPHPLKSDVVYKRFAKLVNIYEMSMYFL